MIRTVLASLLLLALFAPGTALAQSGNNEISVTVSPAIFEVAGFPGETIDGSVTFANNSTTPLAGFIEAQGLVPIDDIIDQGRRSQFDASSWFSFTNSSVAFEGNSQQEVPFQIQIPEEANPGGHYAFITLKPGVIENARSDTSVQPELSASVFITVAGDIDEQAELIGSDLETGNITKDSETEFTFRIRNTGNVHILPAPILTVSKDGAPLDRIALQPQLILPNTEKTFTVPWLADVDFGEYQVRAETVYGTQSIPLATTEFTFYVVPNYLQIALLISLVPVVLFLLIKRRNIPRMIAVLRGHANYPSGAKRYSRSAGQQSLPKPDKGVRTVSEIAEELDRRPLVLGLPDSSDDTFFKENRERTQSTPDEPKKEQQKTPEVLSKTKVSSSSDTTTFITQTSASTIVREQSPFFDPSQETEQAPKKITVTEHEEEPAEKAHPEVTKKKSATKKATKKTAAKKKPAAKKAPGKATKATKKATVKKKTVTSTSTAKSSAKKKSTVKKASPKKAAAKKAPAKKAATAKTAKKPASKAKKKTVTKKSSTSTSKSKK